MPPADPFTFPDDDEPPIPRRRRKSRGPVLVLAGLVAALVLVVGVVALCARNHNRKREEAEAAAKATDPAPEPKPAPPRQKAAFDAGPPKPPPKKADLPKPTFEGDWQLALEAAKTLDEEEAAKTAAAMRLLTAAEQRRANGLAEREARPEWIQAALDLGLNELAARMSRRSAVKDQQFRDIASVVWDPDMGADGLIRMMNRWGLLSSGDRLFAAQAVAAGQRPATMQKRARDALLLLGCEWWLARD